MKMRPQTDAERMHGLMVGQPDWRGNAPVKPAKTRKAKPAKGKA